MILEGLSIISSSLSSIKAGFDITKQLKESIDSSSDIIDHLFELNDILLSLQQNISLLHEEKITSSQMISDLKQQISDKEEWERKKNSYDFYYWPSGFATRVLGASSYNHSDSPEKIPQICNYCLQRHDVVSPLKMQINICQKHMSLEHVNS